MKVKATTREPSPSAKMLVTSKKSKSLEFPKSKSSRPTTNVWDVIDKQPEIAKKIVDTKTTGKKKKAENVLLKTHKALKEVVERKEKLYQILKDLEPLEKKDTKKKKLKKKKKVTIPTALSSDLLDQDAVIRSLSPLHFTKPFQDLVAKLQETAKEDALSQGAIPEQDFVAKFAEPPMENAKAGQNQELHATISTTSEPQKPLEHTTQVRNVLEPPIIPPDNKNDFTTPSSIPEVGMIHPRLMEIKSETPAPIPKFDSLVDLVESYYRPFKENSKPTDIIESRQKEKSMVQTETQNHTQVETKMPNIPSAASPKSVSQTIIDQFSLNLERSPQLIRDFVSVVPFEKENGGLSLRSQGDVIHYGTRLEAKILEMMKLYNNYLNELGTICLCR
jgi:hypothetical protein